MFAVYKIPPNQILMLLLMSLLVSPCSKDVSLSFLSVSLLSLLLSPYLLLTHQNQTKTNKTTPTCNSPSHLQPLTLDTALLHFMQPVSTVLYVSAHTCLHLESLKDALKDALPLPSCPIPDAGRCSSDVLPHI